MNRQARGGQTSIGVDEQNSNRRRPGKQAEQQAGLAYRVLAAIHDHLVAPQAGGVVVAPLGAPPLAKDALPGQRLGLQGTRHWLPGTNKHPGYSRGVTSRASCCEANILCCQGS